MIKQTQAGIIPILILIARPAAGKSEIIHFLKNLQPEDRLVNYHLGKLHVIDDFPFLWRWFEEDEILQSINKPRLYTDSKGYFEVNYFWDLLIFLIKQYYYRFVKENPNVEDYSVILEFSRGREHGGYQRALPLLGGEILQNSTIMYIDVSWEESLRKNRRRFNPDKPGSILEHSLPDEKLKRLYYECDFKQIASDDETHLKIDDFSIPYTIFKNEDDVTTNPGHLLVDRLRVNLEKLWKLRNSR